MITFSEEELENYFRLQNTAEEYINRLIRFKKLDMIAEAEKEHNDELQQTQ
jgi:hypothetical protein